MKTVWMPMRILTQVLTSMVLPCLMLVYGQENVIAQENKVQKGLPIIDKGVSRNESIRFEFMARVKGVDDLTKQKESLINAYIDLAISIKKMEQMRDKNEAELAMAKSHDQSERGVIRMIARLHNRIASMESLQSHIVQSYHLLTMLDELETAFKKKSLPQGQYIQQKRDLNEQIAHVEQARMFEKNAVAIRDSLDSIEDAVESVERRMTLSYGP